MKKIMMSIMIGLMVIVAGIGIFMFSNQKNHNKNNLRSEIMAIKQGIDTIALNDLTPFEWDAVYFFAPYTQKEDIYRALGFKWNGIKTTVNEGTMQVLFIKKNKVVCYCHEYGTTAGYYIDATIGNNQQYKVLYSQDKPVFKISRQPNCIYVEYIE